MQHERIFTFALDRIDDLCITTGTKRCHNNRLRLATSEHG